MAKKNQEKADRYFQLHHYMLKTDAWRALSAAARAIYIQIGSRYNGANNGRLAFSVRDAASECRLNKDTAGKALKELVDLGFIEETRHGGLSRKTRIASEWRMTAFRCDLTGAMKTCAFMQRGAQARESLLARARPQLGRLSETRAATVRNEGTACPKRGDTQISTVRNEGTLRAVLGGPPVPNEGTHIIYHVGSEAAKPPPDTLPPSRRKASAASGRGVVPPSAVIPAEPV